MYSRPVKYFELFMSELDVLGVPGEVGRELSTHSTQQARPGWGAQQQPGQEQHPMVASKPAGKLKPGVCSSHQGNDIMRAGLVEQRGVMGALRMILSCSSSLLPMELASALLCSVLLFAEVSTAFSVAFQLSRVFMC